MPRKPPADQLSSLCAAVGAGAAGASGTGADGAAARFGAGGFLAGGGAAGAGAAVAARTPGGVGNAAPFGGVDVAPPGGPVSGVMMLTGGIDAELGKSPDSGLPVGVDGGEGGAAFAVVVVLPQFSA